MINRSPNNKEIPLNIVGSSVFGRYPKINNEYTYNSFISDGFLVPYAGYRSVIEGFPSGNGRAIYSSSVLNQIIAIYGNVVYRVSANYNSSKDTYTTNYNIIGTLATSDTDIFISENNAGQIAISDSINIYIYWPSNDVAFQIANIDFKPGYISFHDTYFICASLGTNEWRLSDNNNGLSWPYQAANVGNLETKPDNVVGVIRLPGKGNTILVFGENVTEFWTDVGYQLFPYQRNQSANIDYGCVNPTTIASMDEIVVWLAYNEKSGPIIMYCDGGGVNKITTDGIDNLFSTLQNPASSEAFIYRQDGHLFYHINFYEDNLSLFYDFNTQKFYHSCDENFNYFIAKDICFFNNQYYFLSRNNNNFYALDTSYTDYDGEEIPRIRICKNIRLPTQEYFIANDVGFTVEQGMYGDQYVPGQQFFIVTNALDFIVDNDGNFIVTSSGTNQKTAFAILPRIDLSISIDGGETFGNSIGIPLNTTGKRKNKLQWWRLGAANDMVCQFRFWGMGRFVATDGVINIRQ